MKKILLILGMTLVLTGGLPTSAKDRTSDKEKTEKIKFGYDGGMMLHTGYLQGTIPQISHQAKGMPFGIGGAIKFHIGKHFRVGSEARSKTPWWVAPSSPTRPALSRQNTTGRC